MPENLPSVRAELNVLVLIDHLALGGAEMLLSQFARAAPSAGIRLSVACLREADQNPAGERLRAAGVDPVNLDAPERIGLRALRQVGQHIASVQPDIVHTHLGTSDVLGTVAARLLRVPAVSSIHTTDWSTGGNRARARRALMAGARRHCAARIIAVSESARRAYLAQGWSAPERIVTIHNGTDVSPTKGSGAAVRRELGIGPSDLVLGMVSALRPEKGHDIAIAAVQVLRQRFPQLRLVIAGAGPARPTVARLAESVDDAIVLVGARADVMPLYDALDICLHPSRADAFPTTLLEAMAASVPVVASRVGGIPEIIDDGHNGILVAAPPTTNGVADAVARLLDDPRRRRELGEAGRRRYEACFRTGPWLARTRAVYELVLLEARSGPPTHGRSSVADRSLAWANAVLTASLLRTARAGRAAAHHRSVQPDDQGRVDKQETSDSETLERASTCITA